ncbi:hypothetical protein BDR26DRAFT_936415 [Obelidium mucronatum]|nr:hypothetical protein BDR26DRAFT_936415 [Obelidium mucronatum]
MRECTLPLVLSLQKRPSNEVFASQLFFPYDSSADFGIAEIKSVFETGSLFPVVIPVDVKTEKELVDKLDMNAHRPRHNPGIVQTAVYALYSMLRLLPHLSDPEKRDLFGEDIALYTLVLTHKALIIVKVSPLGFHETGKFLVHWSPVLEGNDYVTAVTSFMYQAVHILNKLRQLSLLCRLSEWPPKYCWLPFSEYEHVFPNIYCDPSHHQTFTNPIVKAGDFYYRLFNTAIANSSNSRVEALATLAQLFTFKHKTFTEPLLVTPFVNPFVGWDFKENFMAVPDCGTSLEKIVKVENPPSAVTFSMIKNLLRSVLDNSLCSLYALKYCHMDIRLGNVCTTDLVGWTNSRLIDYKRENPMTREHVQYPDDEFVVPTSDVWMVGYLLGQLGNERAGSSTCTSKNVSPF